MRRSPAGDYRFELRARPSAKYQYAFVIPDVHRGYLVDTPTYSPGCWDIGMQAIAAQLDRLTHIVILGDFGDWGSLSHWASLRADQPFIEEDVAIVNAGLDEIERLIQGRDIEVVFIEGNHEAWASLLEAKYPVLRNQINLKTRLRIRERGWTWVPENRFYRLGKLYLTHGHVKGVRDPGDMVKKFGVSVMYGHTHRALTDSVWQLTGQHAAWTVGHWASVDPPPAYARGQQPENWVHGFTQVQVRRNGKFQVDFRRIIDESWCELADGTELIARPREIEARLRTEAKIRADLRRDYEERFYIPGGQVVNPEPLNGRREAAQRTARARQVRSMHRPS